MRDTDVLPRLSAESLWEACGFSYKSERSAEYLWYRRSVFIFVRASDRKTGEKQGSAFRFEMPAACRSFAETSGAARRNLAEAKEHHADRISKKRAESHHILRFCTLQIGKRGTE